MRIGANFERDFEQDPVAFLSDEFLTLCLQDKSELVEKFLADDSEVSKLLQSVGYKFEKLKPIELEALYEVGERVTSLELGDPDDQLFLDVDDCHDIVSFFPKLKKLSIVKCQTLTPACFELFLELSDLKFLNLRGVSVSDDALQGFHQLQELRLFQCETVTDSMLKLISTFEDLTTLEISGFKNEELTDTGFGHLRALANLTHLNISRNPKLTDNALDYVLQIDSLQALDISFCDQLTESGIAQAQKLGTVVVEAEQSPADFINTL